MRYWIETLGCPKNHVDSDKLAGLLESQGYAVGRRRRAAPTSWSPTPAPSSKRRARSRSRPSSSWPSDKRASARLVVTGCMAERYGDELAAALPEVDLVAGFGESLTALASTPVALRARPIPSFDLLNLPRPKSATPWAYVKIAEGCDRRCGFCAIPSFRGDQRSRSTEEILTEARALVDGGVRELVLIAQDLASWGHDRRRAGRGEAVEVLDEGGTQPLIELTRTLGREVDRVRLLYLYPSGLTERAHRRDPRDRRALLRPLAAARLAAAAARACDAGATAIDSSSASRAIRASEPDATFRSSFILGYPGETEDDQRRAARVHRARRNSIGPGSSPSPPKRARRPTRWAHQVPHELALERLREVSELQDDITARRRDALVGTTQRAPDRRAGRGAQCPRVPRD